MNHSDRTMTSPIGTSPIGVEADTEEKLGSKPSGNRSPRKSGLFDSVIAPILAPIASLKLTVGLLILSVFVIWVATLQQTEMDIWAVKALHFPYLFVYIPLYTFCPPAWLPTWRTALTETGFGIFIPSGFSVILAMLINLAAAHTLRFRVQASGTKLIIGTILAAAGIALCAAVVAFGQSNGIQGKPPVNFGTMWFLVLGAMFSCGIASAVAATRLNRERVIERIFAFSAAVLLCALPILLLYTGASIGDSGMRILWQIAQCSAASLVLYGGLSMIFRRKAGIVLLHAGLILLLGNEIWVTLNHVEQRIGGKEGETISHGIDIRETELVLVNRDTDKDLIYTVPSTLLNQSAKAAAESEAAWISIPNSDLQVRCLKYFKNSDISVVGTTADPNENPATVGVGQRVVSHQLDPVDGLEQNKRDIASTYVQFRSSKGDDLGTFLATEFQGSGGPIFAGNILNDGEKRYAVSLWLARTYKPYDITVQNIESTNYPGTEIPFTYSTEFRIVDHETGYEGLQKVWMNNPVRYRNETFYQSGYFKDPATGIESTTLQVVLNRGWMIPYLCCAMVAIGLLAQFLPNMLVYSERQRKVTLAQTQEGASKSGRTSLGQEWMIPVIAASLVAITFAGWAYPKKPKQDNLDLTSLATLPVSYQGRVQPLDSLARTALRKSVGREEASTPEMTMFGSEKKYPAMVWLADTLFESQSKRDYRIYQVYDRQLLDNLRLPARSGFRYTNEEIDKSIEVLQTLDSNGRKKEAEDRDALDKAALDLGSNIAMSRMILTALGKPAPRLIESAGPSGEAPFYLQLLSAATTKSTTELPGVVPGTEPFAPWLTLDEANVRMQLEEIAGDLNQTDEVAVRVVLRALAEALINDPELKSEMKMLGENKSKAEQIGLISDRLRGLAPEQINLFVNKLFGFDGQKFVSAIYSAVNKLMDGEEIVHLTPTQRSATLAWSEIKSAYVDRDQQKLDDVITEYKSTLREDDKAEIPWTKISAEYSLSGWAPFYVSSVLCLVVSIMSVPSVLGLPRLRKTAFLLLLLCIGLMTVGLIARIYISGRAPVTSLYSSALGIAWGCTVGFAILEAVTRRGIANVLGGFAGFAILLTAYNLSLDNDKFSVLRAVLDTQFWLWTHVTCVALGYVLTLLAGFWSCSILYFAITSDRSDVKQSADLTYGIICAATILSFVGTVLGGLWADDSWGRFWGWDPKENGAAMIVLWNAAVLHARWAGLIRYRGLMVMSVIGNMITLWSWFAVNELGIGLHSYGFTEGVIFYLTIVWGIHLGVIALAFLPVKNLSNRLAKS